jgi:microcystin-dependent protein
MEPYIGEIRLFGAGFAPAGWMLCQGQILSVAEYDTLFSLLGTTYGGDGQTTFALPDLGGRVPVHPGLSTTGGLNISLGEVGGTESVTLTIGQMPTHNHGATVVQSDANPVTFKVNSGNPTTDMPAANLSLSTRGGNATDPVATFNTSAPDTALNGGSITPIVVQNAIAGGSQPHDNMQPFLVMNYIIAVQGIYPPQP